MIFRQNNKRLRRLRPAKGSKDSKPAVFEAESFHLRRLHCIQGLASLQNANLCVTISDSAVTTVKHVPRLYILSGMGTNTCFRTVCTVCVCTYI